MALEASSPFVFTPAERVLLDEIVARCPHTASAIRGEVRVTLSELVIRLQGYVLTPAAVDELLGQTVNLVVARRLAEYEGWDGVETPHASLLLTLLARHAAAESRGATHFQFRVALWN